MRIAKNILLSVVITIIFFSCEPSIPEADTLGYGNNRYGVEIDGVSWTRKIGFIKSNQSRAFIDGDSVLYITMIGQNYDSVKNEYFDDTSYGFLHITVKLNDNYVNDPLSFDSFNEPRLKMHPEDILTEKANEWALRHLDYQYGFDFVELVRPFDYTFGYSTSKSKFNFKIIELNKNKGVVSGTFSGVLKTINGEFVHLDNGIFDLPIIDGNPTPEFPFNIVE
ncbi:hypothetical protein V6R21_02075 [Limibacter armeniacum]|uniref:hypothetical protein n=1 Tax=Limibacter armeniacum TaxID=466084 RepID=UPI002FE64550